MNEERKRPPSLIMVTPTQVLEKDPRTRRLVFRPATPEERESVRIKEQLQAMGRDDDES